MNAEHGPGKESSPGAGLASLWREGARLVTGSTCDTSEVALAPRPTDAGVSDPGVRQRHDRASEDLS
jgi:hypothetical protein